MRFKIAPYLAALLAIASFQSASAQWQDITSNLPGSPSAGDQASLLVADDELYVLGETGVYRSNDGGATFSTINVVSGTGSYDLSVSSLRFVKDAGSFIFVGDARNPASNTNGYTPLHRMSAGQNSWTQASQASLPDTVFTDSVEDVAYDAAGGSYYAASNFAGCYYSADGLTWEERRTGLPTQTSGGTGPFVNATSVLVRSGKIFLTVNHQTLGGVYVSVDQAQTWTRTSVPSGAMARIFEQDGRVMVATSGTTTLDQGVYVSGDNGDTWDRRPFLNLLSQIRGNGSLLVATPGNYQAQDLRYSVTRGDTWDEIDRTGLPGNYVWRAIEPSATDLYLIGYELNPTTQGPQNMKVFKRPISQLDLTPEPQFYIDPALITAGFLQNAGTPFSLSVGAAPAGTVSYIWRRGSEVLTNQTTATLNLQAVTLADAGSYTVEIIGANGSSGVSRQVSLSIVPSGPGNGDSSFAQAHSGRPGSLVLYQDFRLLHTDGNYMALYGSDGKFMTSRANAADGRLRRGFMDSRGNLMLFGEFTLTRINPDTLADDTSFTPVVFPGSTVRLHDVIELPGRGYLLAVEANTTLNGVAIPRTALFDYAGNYVPTATFAGVGRRLALGPDGKIYIGQNGIQRMFSNGVIDSGFSSAAGGSSFILHPDGTVLYVVGSSASPLRKLNPNGTENTAFTSRIPSLSSTLKGMVVEASGKILLYGVFKTASGVTASGHYRLNADGSPDATYSGARGYEFFGVSTSVNHAIYDPRGSFFFLPTQANEAFPQIGRTGLVKVFADRPGINLWQHPLGQSVASGGSVTLRAGVTGTSSITYQWYKDGSILAGETSPTLVLSGFGAAQAGNYSFIASNASGTVGSRAAKIDLLGAPDVLALSAPVFAVEGTPLNLSVTAAGDATLAYQWTKNGVIIPEATSASYSINSTTVENSGDYRVIVSNGVATVTSDAVSVTYLPVTGRIFPGSATPAPSPVLNSLAVLPDGTYLVGGAAAAGNFANLAFHHVSAAGEVLSDAWTALGQPSLVTTINRITLNRAKDRVYVFASNRFSNVGFFNRYHLNGSLDATFVPAASGAVMAELSDGSVWVASGIGATNRLSLISSTGALIHSVIPPNNVSTTITRIIALDDDSILACGNFQSGAAGSSAVKGMIRVLPSGAIDENFPVFPGGTVVSNMAMQSSGKLVVSLSNNTLARIFSDGSVDTSFSPIALPSGSIKFLEVELNDQIIVFSTASTLRLTKDGALDPSFLPFTDLNTGGAFNAASSHPSGRLYVVGNFVRKSSGTSATTAVLTTTVVPLAFTRPLADISGELGGSATFTPAYYNDGPVTFQWLKNGEPIPGATEETLTLNNLSPADGAGSYAVMITHASGSITSTSAALKVIAAPEIITQPVVAQTVSRGGQLSLAVSAVGVAPLNYQWNLDGVPIPGANSASLSIPSATALNSGCYTVSVSNSLGSIESAKAAVSVQVPYGAFDTAISLTPNSSRRATAIVEIPGGGYYVGGNFTSINGVAQSAIVKISDSGAVLPFTVSGVTMGANFYDIDVQSDGKVLYATNGGYGRLNADGSLDASFPNSTTLAKCLLVVGDTLYVAVQTPGANNPAMRKFNLLTNTEDTAFAANFAAHQGSAFSSTSDLALLSDGKIAFGGTSNNWGIILADGTLAAGFTNVLGNVAFGDPTRDVFGVTAAPGGKVYLSGSFVLGGTRSIARMNGDGSLDTTFNSTFSNTLANGVLDGDGIVVRGSSAGLTRFGPTGAFTSPTNGGTNSVNSLMKDSQSRAVFGTTNAPLVGRVQLDSGKAFQITCEPFLASTPVPGQSLTVAVAWSGTGPVTYQWRKDGNNIPGATGQSHEIASYDPALHDGIYSVVINGPSGSLSSTGQVVPSGDPVQEFYASSGLPEGQRTDDGDYDNDGVSNFVEYLYGSNPGAGASTAAYIVSESSLGGSELNAIAALGLDPALNYYVAEIRIPKDLKGASLNVPATTSLLNFGDGSATMNAFGPAMDDGDFIIQRHYALPAIQVAGKTFWRVEASR